MLLKKYMHEIIMLESESQFFNRIKNQWELADAAYYVKEKYHWPKSVPMWKKQ